MKNLLLTISLTLTNTSNNPKISKKCTEPLIIGNVPQKIINAIKIRCGFIYPFSPCVKYIKEKGENNYQVICKGKVNDKKEN